MKVIMKVEKEVDIPLKEANEYNDQEKITIFNKLHAEAKSILISKSKNGYEPKDCKHYAFESLMGLLGKNVWGIWNGLDE